MAATEKTVKPGEPLIVGSIIKNFKGEYGIVMPDQRICRVTKEEAEKIMREAEGSKS